MDRIDLDRAMSMDPTELEEYAAAVETRGELSKSLTSTQQALIVVWKAHPECATIRGLMEITDDPHLAGALEQVEAATRALAEHEKRMVVRGWLTGDELSAIVVPDGGTAAKAGR